MGSTANSVTKVRDNRPPTPMRVSL
jgi:hypothetical protein